MPPKGKDKGKKGAKGAGAVPNVIDEPPQPPPGTPHCLCLVLEVSLFVDPLGRPAASRGSDGGIDGGEDVAQGNEPILVEPVFRYTFINGERITTPPIGLPGSSWTRLNPAATVSENAQEADQSTTAVKEPAGAADADRQPDADEGPREPIVWRYTRTHQLQGADEDEVWFIYRGGSATRDRMINILIMRMPCIQPEQSMFFATIYPSSSPARQLG